MSGCLGIALGIAAWSFAACSFKPGHSSERRNHFGDVHMSSVGPAPAAISRNLIEETMLPPVALTMTSSSGSATALCVLICDTQMNLSQSQLIKRPVKRRL